MLDKNDLLQIGQLLDEKIDPILRKLNSIEEEIAGIKITLERIDIRTDEDVKITHKEIEMLKKRIISMEKEIKILKAQNI